MALTDDNGMVMPVQPMYGGGYNYPVAVPMGGYGYGNGFGGGDWGSFIVLFLIAAMFGGFGGGWGGFGMGGFGNEMFTFPWLLAGQNGINQNVNSGFDNAAVGSQLSAIQSTLASNEVANCNRAIDNLQTAYNNQIADLNRSFDSQTAIDNHLDTLSMSLQKCCCDNELATANLGALVQRENCQDREALSNGIRDIISSQTAGTQRILDQMCQDKIDAKNERITSLENQVAMQNLAASQAAQTAQLIADNNAQSQLLIQRIAPYPIPAYPVSNPYGCNGWNNGYNYGFNNFGFNPFGNVGFGNGSF